MVATGALRATGRVRVRGLLRAQVLHDTREDVMAVDTAADPLAWLVGAAFDLVAVDR